MGLHPKDEAAIGACVGDLRALFAARLRAVALVGEAAGEGYRERASPLDLVVVLDEVVPADLRTIRPTVRRWRWRRRRVSTPVLMDPAYIEGSRDVFPLEFLEMRDHHRMLHGAEDFFGEVEVNREHLRLEVEEQIKGKLLHLRQAYLELGWFARPLRRLLIETPFAFDVILRGMLALHGDARPDDPDDVLATVERAFEIALPTFHRLERVRHGRERLATDELEAVFDAYVAEVRALGRAVNTL